MWGATGHLGRLGKTWSYWPSTSLSLKPRAAVWGLLDSGGIQNSQRSLLPSTLQTLMLLSSSGTSSSSVNCFKGLEWIFRFCGPDHFYHTDFLVLPCNTRAAMVLSVSVDLAVPTSGYGPNQLHSLFRLFALRHWEFFIFIVKLCLGKFLTFPYWLALKGPRLTLHISCLCLSIFPQGA